MKFSVISTRRTARVLCATASIATLTVLMSSALTAQSNADSASAAAKRAAALAAASTSAVDAPISMCIVPGSGTAYRVGGPGLPAQCLAASHTLMSLNAIGPQGIQGLAGLKGDSGAIGAIGPQGLPGVAGLVGPAGPVGATGAAGATGTSGAAGAPGIAGTAGAQGTNGVDGAQGSNGIPGAQGAPGTTGPMGAPGTTDHSMLTNLSVDSHTQYLRVDGSRSLSGSLSANGFKLTGLAPATAAGDAVRFDQAVKTTDVAAGDVGGTFAGLQVRGLYGRSVLSTAPTANQVLTWNGSAWAPATAAGGGGGVTAHNALTGLTDDDHPQYLIGGDRVFLNGFSVTGNMNQGQTVPSGAGTRLVWNPRKGAFRAGTVEGIGADWWNDSDVGYNSTAIGLNNHASGNASFAAGYRSSAEGTESFAVGNEALASGQASVALGGHATGYGSLAVGNMAFATGHVSIALGQQANASGSNATAIGPSNASGIRSVAIGTSSTANAEQSLAFGNNASTNGFKGAIVIGAVLSDMDNYMPTLLATAENQLSIRAPGGTRIYSDANMTTGVTLAPGGGSWSTVSDRNKKMNFRDVSGESLLAQLRDVPVTSWAYKAQSPTIRHIGPMAQDWEHAFGLSHDSTTINTGDIAGVTLAGVQALAARTTGAAARIVSLEERVRELELQVQQLLQIVRQSRTADAAGKLPR